MLLEDLLDRRRICVMLRIDGWSYAEIGASPGIAVHLVRHGLEQVTTSFPGLLDHRRKANAVRALRLAYLLSLNDAGVEVKRG